MSDASDKKFEVIDAGETVWRFDKDFLDSNWTCIFGQGCHGIEADKAAHLGRGCCALGAHIDGIDEAHNISALADVLSPDIFQYHAQAAAQGVFSDAEFSHTRIIEGACIFLNRPGFSGGAGCALHLGALSYNESPIDWKPSVCWQLPIKVDWEMRSDDVEIATVRRWTRQDWGESGNTMAWCCTQEPEAYIGTQTVLESLSEELKAIVGQPVYLELRRRH